MIETIVETPGMTQLPYLYICNAFVTDITTCIYKSSWKAIIVIVTQTIIKQLLHISYSSCIKA